VKRIAQGDNKASEQDLLSKGQPVYSPASPFLLCLRPLCAAGMPVPPPCLGKGPGDTGMSDCHALAASLQCEALFAPLLAPKGL